MYGNRNIKGLSSATLTTLTPSPKVIVAESFY